MSDQNDTSQAAPEPTAVTTAETDELIKAQPLEQEPAVAGEAGSEADAGELHSVEPDQQVQQDEEEGDELPLAVVGEEVQSLSERFNAQAGIEDDLRRAEDEMSYLREQIRQDPTVLAAVQEQQSKLE